MTENLKQRLHRSLETLRASLDPETLGNDDEMNRRLRDLDYVIAVCKDFPPSQLPPKSELILRKPREKPRE